MVLKEYLEVYGEKNCILKRVFVKMVLVVYYLLRARSVIEERNGKSSPAFGGNTLD